MDAVNRLQQRVGPHLRRARDAAGGTQQAWAITLLACALALDAADKGAVGALAVQLEHDLRVGNAKLGLLVTVSSLVGAFATIPIGALTDRYCRVRLLWVSILFWGAAEAAGGLAPSFAVLLATRVALGAVTGTAGPTVASLTGDYFSPGERARIYGFILTGEFIGTGIGVLAADAVGAATWRAAFIVLGAAAPVLAWAMHRWLQEPARGASTPTAEDAPQDGDGDRDLVLHLVEQQDVKPDERNVIRGDAHNMTLWQAVAYVLRVRTNVILIIAGSLGYFFFAGLSTFAVVYLHGRYHMGQASATAVLFVVAAGALVGLVVIGRSGDMLLRRGRIDGRILVGVVGYCAAAVLLVPAFVAPWLLVSVPLFVVAAACIAAPNPSMDAARLDVVPPPLWGRAEGVRTLVRQAFQALAPFLFGSVSELLSGGRAPAAGIDGKYAPVTHAQAEGLRLTFLVMLVPLLVSGLVLLRARSSYPVDVASAASSDVPPRASPRPSRGAA